MPSAASAELQALGHGIFALDSGYVRPRFDAIHLIVECGRAALIDTATQHSVPRVLDALAALGLTPGAVDYVILTHVHLDHAGGAGALMQSLPNARLVVHPRGARHMIDPSKLWQATCEVYGAEQAQRLYGQIVPVAPERMIEAHEGSLIDLAGRTLQCLDAPGHARHHIVVRDAESHWIFTGDTFGISYREFDVDGRALVFPSSTPVQFDPPALKTTIERLIALSPPAVLLTHYSKIDDVASHGVGVLRLIDDYARIGRQHRNAGPSRRARIRADLQALTLSALREHGVTIDESTLTDMLHTDITLNADGIDHWVGTLTD